MKHKILLPLLLLFAFGLGACKKSGCSSTGKTDCICTMEADPVCGCDNKTYGNPCMAACAGVTEFTKGVCP